MNPPLVSVIIPCLNADNYIIQTLDSVCSQDYEHLEVIVVDNGSSDKTVDLVENYPDDRVSLLHEPVKNANIARNKGIKAAKGEYFQFLDADDTLALNKISQQVGYLEKSSDDIVVSDRVIWDESMSKEIQRLTFERITQNTFDVLFSEIIITGNPLYKKRCVIAEGGFNEDLKVAQDWEFNLRLFKSNYRFGYLPGFFLNCRQLDNSLSSDWKKVSIVGWQVIQKLDFPFELFQKNPKSLKKLFFIFSDAIIYSKTSPKNVSASIVKYNLNTISKQFSQGITRLMLQLIGLKNTLLLKRKFSKKNN